MAEKHQLVKEGLGNNEEIRSRLKEIFWPFLVFAAAFAVFKLFSIFNLIVGLPIIFIVLLVIFAKDTKSLFYMFIISLPFTGSDWAFRLGETGSFFRISYFFFMLVFASFFFNKLRAKDYSFSITSIDLPLFSFLFVAAVSVFQTAYIGNDPLILYDTFRNYPWIRGFLAIMFILFMYAIYYVTANIVSEKKTFRNALFVFIITAVIVSTYGLFGFFYAWLTSSHLPASIDPLIDNGSRIMSVFNEPLFFGSYLLSIIPVFYTLLISRTRYFSKYFLMAASLILTLVLILTGSRGAWFGYFISLVVLVVIYWKSFFECAYKKFSEWMCTRGVKIIFVILSLFLLLLIISNTMLWENTNKKSESIYGLIPGGTAKPMQEISKYISAPFKFLFDNTLKPIMDAIDPSANQFWSSRIRIWSMQYAWEGFKQHPILGVGYSNYLFYSGFKVYEGIFEYCAMNFPEVNNYPLKILAEMGLVGFIIFVWLFIKTIRSAVTAMKCEKDEAKKAMITGYLLAFIAVSAQLLFYSYITLAYIWVMLAMMMSLCNMKRINLKKEEN